MAKATFKKKITKWRTRPRSRREGSRERGRDVQAYERASLRRPLGTSGGDIAHYVNLPFSYQTTHHTSQPGLKKYLQFN